MRSLQTVAALTCMKTSLVVFNVLFWITGLLLLILGIWLHFELHRYSEISTTPSESPVAPYIFVVSGLIILLTGTVACCCSVNEKPLHMYVYAFVVSALLLVEMTACIAAYSYEDELSGSFDRGFNESMGAFNQDHWKSSQVNLVQTHINCCGITGPRDWYSTPYGKIPGSCCTTNMGCDTRDKRMIHKQGCSQVVRLMIHSNIRVSGLVAGAVGVFQATGVLLSIVLGKLVEKNKYEHISS